MARFPTSTAGRAFSSVFLLSLVSVALLFVWLYQRDYVPAVHLVPIVDDSPGRHGPTKLVTPLDGEGVGHGADRTSQRPIALPSGPPTAVGGDETRPGDAAVPAADQEEEEGGAMSGTQGSGPVVRLPQGTYVGEVMPAGDGRLPRAVDAWRGIPYARSRRLEPATPLGAADGTARATHAATAFGPICPRARADPDLPASEDCLNLNVYRAHDAAAAAGGDKRRTKGLPVVVYVHGGAFNVGKASERNMAYFVAFSEAPIIGVNFNYRLGPLGFLPAGLTAKAGILNLGLRDQQLAFGWVRDHAAAFGGDPENITLMGLSAGGHSIGHQIMAYEQGKAPFHKCILESGATTARAVFDPTHPRHELQFREFLVAAGLGSVPEHEVLDAVRRAPLERLTAAWRQIWDAYEPSVRWPFQPAIDGGRTGPAGNATIPARPVDSWARGTGSRLPLVTGFNTNEGTSFIPKAAETNADFRAFFRLLIPTLADADLDILDRLYPDPATDPSSPYAGRPRPPGTGAQWHRLDRAYAHYAYVCPVLHTAHYMSLAGRPVRVYEYAAVAAPFDAANHADEAPAAAHDMDLLRGTPGLVAVADAMHGFFAAFAASADGDPNAGPMAGHEPAWPAFVSPFTADGVRKTGADAAAAGQILVFGRGNDERATAGRKNRGTPAVVRSLSDEEIEQCEFWWSRVELSQGLGRRTGGAPSARL